MKRVVFLGRGGAGKSTAARRLGTITGLSVIELDKHFWQPGLVPLSHEKWSTLQHELAGHEKWIMDGDFGVYDVLSERLKAADTIIILNFSLWVCFLRAFRRSKERSDFWWWLFTWRWKELPKIRKTIEAHAPRAKVLTFRSPHQLEKFLSGKETIR